MRMSVAAFGWLTASLMQPAFAVEYTKQEKANIQLVQEFYAAPDAADANANMGEAIVGIAEKYIAPNYKIVRMAPPAAAGTPLPGAPAKK